MAQKRYAIVRVDKNCPFSYEKQNKKAFLSRCLPSTFQCKDCYGDTKEQLIRKVAQSLRRALQQGFYKGYTEIANEIVEFLGVKE